MLEVPGKSWKYVEKVKYHGNILVVAINAPHFQHIYIKSSDDFSSVYNGVSDRTKSHFLVPHQ